MSTSGDPPNKSGRLWSGNSICSCGTRSSFIVEMSCCCKKMKVRHRRNKEKKQWKSVNSSEKETYRFLACTMFPYLFYSVAKKNAVLVGFAGFLESSGFVTGVISCIIGRRRRDLVHVVCWVWRFIITFGRRVVVARLFVFIFLQKFEHHAGVSVRRNSKWSFCSLVLAGLSSAKLVLNRKQPSITFIAMAPNGVLSMIASIKYSLR